MYFAHCYPYTYTQLCRYLRELENDPHKKTKVKRKTLCTTIAGNNCDYVIIGDFNNNNNGNNNKEKKGIMLSSRVHPGESMTSYVIEYIIDYLTGNSQEAKILRENFIIKVKDRDFLINHNAQRKVYYLNGVIRAFADKSKFFFRCQEIYSLLMVVFKYNGFLAFARLKFIFLDSSDVKH